MKHAGAHSHAWLVATGGIVAGAVMLVHFPKVPTIAGVIALAVLFHLVGAVVLVGSAWSLAPARLRRLARMDAPDDSGVSYGWSFGALYGPWLAALAVGGLAAGLWLEAPGLWPLTALLVVQAAAFFVGGVLMRASKRRDWATLPLVPLLRKPGSRVLDAGCGAGRTTLAVSRVLGDGRVVAVDRFDASYIEQGGRELLARNLRAAGLEGKVEVVPGDLTALPLAGGSVDAAVSAHAIDHLGPAKQKGVDEIFRVLAPGGRFLLVVWVPGWAMLAIASVASLFLTPKRGWRAIADRAGFRRVDEGLINGAWFLLLEKPGME
jgi:SAM-dependent methyltransferase